MRTRSSDARERRRAIAALAGVAGRLAEDYLLMLPEALPFLAELLEDPDPPTQARPAPAWLHPRLSFRNVYIEEAYHSCCTPVSY